MAIEPDVSKYWFEKLLQLVVRRDFFPFPHRVGRLMLLASILSRRLLCLVGIENLPASPSLIIPDGIKFVLIPAAGPNGSADRRQNRVDQGMGTRIALLVTVVRPSRVSIKVESSGGTW
jgi:hypothetical protein